MDNVCNRRLFSIPSKVEMAEEQENGLLSTTPNMWQYVATHRHRVAKHAQACCAQQCCDMLRLIVKIVWPWIWTTSSVLFS